MASSQDRLPEDIRDAAASWLIERSNGASSAERDAEFAAWLTADPRHAEAYARLERSWDLMAEAELGEPRDQWTPPSPLSAVPAIAPMRRFAFHAVAASLALILIGVVQDWPTRLRADATTATGEQRLLVLADGSRIRLNTASAIAVDYRDDRRIIHLLKGEAAFTVAADAARPFTVEAAGGSATALGTRFTVRSDSGGADVAVTEHVVRVAAPAEGGSIDVAQGHAVHFGPDGLRSPHMIDIAEAEAWTNERMFFVDRKLGEVVAEIDRYHPGIIRVVGSKLSERRFSGVLPTNDPLGALDTIEQTLGIGSTRITDRVVFLHN